MKTTFKSNILKCFTALMVLFFVAVACTDDDGKPDNGDCYGDIYGTGDCGGDNGGGDNGGDTGGGDNGGGDNGGDTGGGDNGGGDNGGDTGGGDNGGGDNGGDTGGGDNTGGGGDNTGGGDNGGDTDNVGSSKLTAEEKKLYKLIMEYRRQNGLGKIPLSKSLSYVAKSHVIDLDRNQPVGGGCNLHSWSSKGKWSPCCYTGDHRQAKCMWDKPKELTSYTGPGYEIAFGGGGGYKATAQQALNGWKGSGGHNSVILNIGMWRSKWNAIGVAIEGGYSVVWFGHEQDNQ